MNIGKSGGKWLERASEYDQEMPQSETIDQSTAP